MMDFWASPNYWHSFLITTKKLAKSDETNLPREFSDNTAIG